MSAAKQEQEAAPLQWLPRIEPLHLLSAEQVEEAMRAGAMHAPDRTSRMHTSGLQWREGVTLEDLLESASYSIAGAQALAALLGEHEGEALKASRGLQMLLGTAGGAVQLLASALCALDGRPRGSGALLSAAELARDVLRVRAAQSRGMQ